MDSGMFASTQYKRKKLKPISRISVHTENWCIAYMETRIPETGDQIQNLEVPVELR